MALVMVYITIYLFFIKDETEPDMRNLLIMEVTNDTIIEICALTRAGGEGLGKILQWPRYYSTKYNYC